MTFELIGMVGVLIALFAVNQYFKNKEARTANAGKNQDDKNTDLSKARPQRAPRQLALVHVELMYGLPYPVGTLIQARLFADHFVFEKGDLLYTLHFENVRTAEIVYEPDLLSGQPAEAYGELAGQIEKFREAVRQKPPLAEGEPPRRYLCFSYLEKENLYITAFDCGKTVSTGDFVRTYQEWRATNMGIESTAREVPEEVKSLSPGERDGEEGDSPQPPPDINLHRAPEHPDKKFGSADNLPFNLF